MRAAAGALGILVCALAGTAFAGIDDYGLGNGQDGIYTGGGQINAYAPLVMNANAGEKTICLGAVVDTDATPALTGFAVDRLILLHQSSGDLGLGAEEAPAAPPAGVGRYELARIVSWTPGSPTCGGDAEAELDRPLLHGYESPGAQAVTVPEFESLTVDSTIRPSAWDGSVGGIVAFLVEHELGLQADIDASGMGFRPGNGVATEDGGDTDVCDLPGTPKGEKGEGVDRLAYGSEGREWLANGGGGGNCHAGGGGGGHAASGGSAGNSAGDHLEGAAKGGKGGAGIVYPRSEGMLFGGGGGGAQNVGHPVALVRSGNGGAGGGIVFFRTRILGGAGSVLADGLPGESAYPDNGPGGGGGAGGTLVIRIASHANFYGGSFSVKGGDGGDAHSTFNNYFHSAGGGGSGGFALLHAPSTIGLDVDVSGGASGSSAMDFAKSPHHSGQTGGNGGENAKGRKDAPLLPPAPTITYPAAGAVLSELPETLEGTGPAGATLIIHLNGEYLDEVVLTGTTWTYDFDPGEFSIFSSGGPVMGLNVVEVFVVEDDLANSVTLSFTVFAQAAAPTLTEPAHLGVAANPLVTFSGTADPNVEVEVEVFHDGLPVSGCSGPADALGEWSCTVGTPLTWGQIYTAEAIAEKGEPGESDPSSLLLFAVGHAPETFPPVITYPKDGAYVSVDQPVFVGYAQPGAEVEVFVDDGFGPVSVCTAPPAGAVSGEWMCMSTVPLADGPYLVEAISTLDGVASDPSRSVAFELLSEVPDAPFITYPGAGLVTNQVAPLFMGTATGVAASVAVFDGNDDLLCVGQVQAGHWECRPTEALGEGPHTIYARAISLSERQSSDSLDVTFSISLTAPDAPVITEPASGEWLNENVIPVHIEGTVSEATTVAVDVYVNGDLVCPATPVDASNEWSCTAPSLGNGTHVAVAVGIDGASNESPPSEPRSFVVSNNSPPPPVIARPTDNQVLHHQPIFQGHYYPNYTVQVRTAAVPGDLICEAVTNDRGIWTCEPGLGDELADGNHLVRANGIDPAGNVSAPSGPILFVLDGIPPLPPVVTAPLDGGYVNEAAPLISGLVNPADTGDTDWVLVILMPDGPGDMVMCANEVVGGEWACRPTQDLEDGTYTAMVYGVDLADNYSDPVEVTFTVDLTPPEAPTLFYPANDQHISDAPNILRGNAVVSEQLLIDVYLDGEIVCSDLITDHVSGVWGCELGFPLAEGTYSYFAVAKDRAGNVSDFSENWSFHVDRTPPEPPVIASPEDGGWGNSTSLQISGTAEAFGTVWVEFVGGSCPMGATSCYAHVDAYGNWSLSVWLLQEQAYVIRATTRDRAGNESPPSPDTSFEIDLTPPPAPVIATPADGSFTNEERPLFSGTSEPHSTVEVRATTTLCTALTDAAGAWSCLPGADLPEGTYDIWAWASDRAGNFSPSSGLQTFTVHRQTPEAPVVLEPADGSATTQTQPRIAGRALPGETVDVYVDGSLACAGLPTDASGAWSCTPGSPLAEGGHGVVAYATDAAGNLSLPSSPVFFEVVGELPPPPVLREPEDGASIALATPTFVGSAQAGSDVEVRLEAGDFVCAASADSTGQWSCTSDPLQEGAYRVLVWATDRAGQSVASAITAFAIDLTAPAAPEIREPAADSRSNETLPLFAGIAEPGARVELQLDGLFYCGADVDEFGDWSCRGEELVEGAYVAEAIAIDGAGNVSAISAPTRFRIDLTAPDAPVVTSPVAGEWLADPLPTIMGSAEPGLLVDVSIDGETVCADRRAAGGVWSCVLHSALLDGSHGVVATAKDEAGNVSAPSSPVIFHVRTASPDAPTIELPAADSFVATASPLIRGAAESGSRVEVRDVYGTLICATEASGTGAWACLPFAPLTEGMQEIVAVSYDLAGNPSAPSPTVAFTVDLQVPTAPILSRPVPGAVTSDRFPAFEGIAEAGATVEVFLDGGFACGAEADGFGNWLCYAGEPLAEGSHTAVAHAVDAAGNRSESSGAVSFRVELSAPAAPRVLEPVAGEWLGSPVPTFGGTAEADSRVEVRVGGVLACSAQVSPVGTWSCVGAPLADGQHVAIATATGPSGLVSGASEPVAFQVRTEAPQAPVITSPAEGAIFADLAPTFSGRAGAGHRVTVEVGAGPVCATTADEMGFWSCQSQPLGEGEHIAVATALDPAGNPSAPSAPRRFTVKTAPPTAPSLLEPVHGSEIADAAPLVAGRAEAGVEVSAFVDGVLACSTFADTSGAWACRPTAPLSEGGHSVRAQARDAAGNLSGLSIVHTFTVRLSGPQAPAVLAPVAGSWVAEASPRFAGTSEAGVRIEVRVDGVLACTTHADGGGAWGCSGGPLADGLHSVLAVAIDGAQNRSAPSAEVLFTVATERPTAPVITAPEEDAYVATSQPTFRGIAMAESLVEVRSIDDRSICFAAVAKDGSWSCAPEGALADGEQRVLAYATDRAGNTSAPSATLRFTILTHAPEVPVVLRPAHEVRTGERTPWVQGTAEPGKIVHVLVDEREACQALVDLDGSWSCRVGFELGEGAHELIAHSEDEAGNFSEPSIPVHFHVDLHAPSAPEITEPVSGSATLETRPLIAGRAPAGERIEVSIDGGFACNATADGRGYWSCVPRTDLEDGMHTAVALAVDAAGNVSEPSVAVAFTVRSTLPPPPVIETPETDALLNQKHVEFRGRAEPGLGIEVWVDDRLVCTTQAFTDGSWQCLSAIALEDGPHVAQATSRDDVGHASEPSEPVRFVLDTEAPEPPIFDPIDGRHRPTIFEGSAEPGTFVHLSVDGEELCVAEVDETGVWSCTVYVEGGLHRAVAVTVDAAGNESEGTVQRFRVLQPEKLGGGGSGCSAGGAGSGGAFAWLVALAALWLGRRRGGALAGLLLAGVVGLGVLGFPGSATAQRELPGFELDKLSLNPGARDGLLLGTGDLLPKGTYRFSVTGHYQSEPLVFYTAEGDRFGSSVSQRTGMHLAGAYAISDRVEVGLHLPILLGQSGDDGSVSGIAPVEGGAGIGTTFAQVRYGPLQEQSGDAFDLAFGLAVGLPLGNASQLAKDDGLMAIPHVEAGRAIASWLRIGARVGMAFRPSQTVVPVDGAEGTEIGHQVLGGLVLSTLGEGLRAEVGGQFDVPISEDGKGGGEIWGGLRYPIAGMAEVYGLAGPGFGNAPGTPTVRTLIGVAFSPQGELSSRRTRYSQVQEAPDEETLRRVREAAYQEGLLAGREEGKEALASCQTQFASMTCPAAAPDRSIRERIYFNLDDATLTPESEAALRRLAAMLRNEPGIRTIRIEGHADPTGPAGYNQELSRARAEAVRARLVSLGVPASRLEVHAFGYERSLVSNASEGGRAYNRRAEVIIRYEQSGGGQDLHTSR